MSTQAMCCARLTGKVTSAKAGLRTMAHRAAIADQKGHPMDAWKRRIDSARTTLTEAEKYLHEHEADHAGEEQRHDSV